MANDKPKAKLVYKHCPRCSFPLSEGQLGYECQNCGLRANATDPALLAPYGPDSLVFLPMRIVVTTPFEPKAGETFSLEFSTD